MGGSQGRRSKLHSEKLKGVRGVFVRVAAVLVSLCSHTVTDGYYRVGKTPGTVVLSIEAALPKTEEVP